MDNAMHRNKGFTLVELMVVVAILSILALLALGAYTDYVVRSKVSEGLAFAAEAKSGVSAYYAETSRVRLPRNNREAGLPPADSYDDNFEYIRKLEISSVVPYGAITITFKIPGSTADGKLLQLIPATVDGTVTWTCVPPAVDGISTNQVPSNCRG
jgi:type IV pilus assembly protein PilA